MIKKRNKVGRQKANDENDNWNGVFKKIILAVVVALLAGGSAPWWWNEFVKAKVGPEVVGPTHTKTDNPTPTVTNTPPIPTITSIPTSVGTPGNTPEISISSGDIWDIGNGWSIKVNAIDVRSNPRQVWITLYRYGNQLDDRVLESRQLDYGGWSNVTYNYNNIFSTEVSIYSGAYSYDVLFTNTTYQ